MKDTIAARADDEGRSRRKAAAEGPGPLTTVVEWPQKARTFLGDVRAETRRVTWPTMEQVRATTVVVIVTVFLFGAYIGGLDWVYTRVIGWILRMGG